MKPAHSLLSLGFLAASALLAQERPDPQLLITLDPAIVRLTIVTEERPFLGAFLVSAEPTLAHYLVGLPPLLADHFLLHVGASIDPRLVITLPDITFPPGMFIYVQGATISESGVRATDVGSFVLDASGTSGH